MSAHIGSRCGVHRPDSKSAADQTSLPQAIKCQETVHNDDGTTEACDFAMKNKHLMLAHYRRDHGLKGTGEVMKPYKNCPTSQTKYPLADIPAASLQSASRRALQNIPVNNPQGTPNFAKKYRNVLAGLLGQGARDLKQQGRAQSIPSHCMKKPTACLTAANLGTQHGHMMSFVQAVRLGPAPGHTNPPLLGQQSPPGFGRYSSATPPTGATPTLDVVNHARAVPLRPGDGVEAARVAKLPASGSRGSKTAKVSRPASATWFNTAKDVAPHFCKHPPPIINSFPLTQGKGKAVSRPFTAAEASAKGGVLTQIGTNHLRNSDKCRGIENGAKDVTSPFLSQYALRPRGTLASAYKHFLEILAAAVPCCDNCEEAFTKIKNTAKDVASHICEKHPPDGKTSAYQRFLENATSAVHRCDKCEDAFMTTSKLDSHMVIFLSPIHFLSPRPETHDQLGGSSQLPADPADIFPVALEAIPSLDNSTGISDNGAYRTRETARSERESRATSCTRTSRTLNFPLTATSLHPPESGSVLNFARKNRWSAIRPETALRSLSSLSTRESRAVAVKYAFTRFRTTRSFWSRRLSTDKKVGSKSPGLPRRRPRRRRSPRRRDSGNEPTAPSYDGNSSPVTLPNSHKSIKTAFAFFLSTAPLLSPRLSCHPGVAAANQETKGKLQLAESESVLSFPRKNRWYTI
ncbi:hypothetical protein DL771_002828 [Monosporascus sp. 5C6A]|nr:hypothetical protein DL771_002828 [Monosporascus sp. 5C6A]